MTITGFFKRFFCKIAALFSLWVLTWFDEGLGLLLIGLVGYLLSFISDISMILYILALVCFGTLLLGIILWPLFKLAPLLIMFSEHLSPSKHGIRYIVLCVVGMARSFVTIVSSKDFDLIFGIYGMVFFTLFAFISRYTVPAWNKREPKTITDAADAYSPDTIKLSKQETAAISSNIDSTTSENAPYEIISESSPKDINKEKCNPSDRLKRPLIIVSVITLLAVGFSAGLVTTMVFNQSKTSETEDSKSVYEYTAIKTGDVILDSEYERIHDLTVIAPKNTDNDYVVYIKYTGLPEKASRKLKKTIYYKSGDDMAFYIEAGHELEIAVPIGEYDVYYCYGNKYVSPEKLFGKDTEYRRLSDKYEFYSDKQYKYHTSIDLGKVKTEKITASTFPAFG